MKVCPIDEPKIVSGDRVLCVDDHWDEDVAFPLVRGVEYTVLAVRPADGVYRGQKDHWVLDLVEVRNPRGVGFAEGRFVPARKLFKDYSEFNRLMGKGD